MEIPSTFHTWLSDQTRRTDAVGKLAASVTQDPGWPVTAEKKEPMRAYLRNHGQKELVPALAMAVQEFTDVEDEFYSGIDEWLGWPEIAEPLVAAWCEMGCPDREEIVTRAEAGEPAALAIFGVRLLLSIAVPRNFLLGVRKLTEAFERSFVPAASVL